MSESTEQPAPTWRQRLATWCAVARSTLISAWSWIKSEPAVFLALCVVVIVVAMITKMLWDIDSQASRSTAHAAPDWTEQARQLDDRVSELEATVGLMVPTAATAPSSARSSSTMASAGTSDTPLPAFGHTDLDRRLAEFQRRIDATPSHTTPIKETAK